MSRGGISIGFGNLVAAVLSWLVYGSIGWVIVHGFFGWFYVIYFGIVYGFDLLFSYLF